jgi:uncharacterized protein (DUF2141 family)
MKFAAQPIVATVALASLAAAFTSAQAQPAAPTAPAAPQNCVVVEVHNVRPKQGNLMVAAYADAESFGKKPAAVMRVAAADAVTTFDFCGLTGAMVLLSMFQDLDSDGKMGTNVMGIPIEPWGSSGKPGMFGPTWETGKVALDGNKIIVKLSQ